MMFLFRYLDLFCFKFVFAAYRLMSLLSSPKLISAMEGHFFLDRRRRARDISGDEGIELDEADLIRNAATSESTKIINFPKGQLE